MHFKALFIGPKRRIGLRPYLSVILKLNSSMAHISKSNCTPRDREGGLLNRGGQISITFSFTVPRGFYSLINVRGGKRGIRGKCFCCGGPEKG